MIPRRRSLRLSGAPAGGYTRAQILLHWALAVLVAGQYATSRAILRTHGMHMIGWKPSPTDMMLHTLHIGAGLAIVALMIARLALRLWIGTSRSSAVRTRSPPFARLIHAAFYAVLIAEGMTGAIASYVWWPISAVHVVLFDILLGLVAIHVAAALWHWRVIEEAPFERMGLGPPRKSR